MKGLKINIETLLKILILLCFAFFFYSIVQTGKVKLYVHPRIVPYVKFSIIVMLLIALCMLGDLFKSVRGKGNIAAYGVFIIPLIIAFVSPAQALNSASGKEVNLLQQTAKLQQKQKSSNFDSSNNNSGNSNANSNASTAAGNNNIDVSAVIQSTPSPTDLPNKQLTIQDNKTMVKQDNFVATLDQINQNPDRFVGKDIELEGFVFRDKGFQQNRFVTARFMISCCTADAQVVGLLCQYENISQYKTDTWVKISGKIKKIEFNGEQIPAVKVENIKTIDSPSNAQDGYVYP